MSFQEILSTVGVLTAMCLVIAAAYYVPRLLAARARPYFGGCNSLRLVDRFVLSKDKMFVLLAVGQSAYLVGITNQSMTLIATLELPEGQETEKQNTAGGFYREPPRQDDSFLRLLECVKDKFRRGGSGGGDGAAQ